MNNSTPGVIVVLGSVSAKQYASLRFKHLRTGRKVRIVRLKNEHYELLVGLISDQAVFNLHMSDDPDACVGIYQLLQHMNCGSADVLGVMALESEWENDFYYGDALLFGAAFADEWPSLTGVTLIRPDGSTYLV